MTSPPESPVPITLTWRRSIDGWRGTIPGGPAGEERLLRWLGGGAVRPPPPPAANPLLLCFNRDEGEARSMWPPPPPPPAEGSPPLPAVFL